MSQLQIINSFDIDGVIYMGPNVKGVYPGQRDVIITGRSFQEEPETRAMLGQRNIFNHVYFNPVAYNAKTREISGQHKAQTIRTINAMGLRRIAIHFEDDEVQAKIIREKCPDVTVVLLVHDLVNKENQRHVNF